MSSTRDPDKLIAAFLDEGPVELRDSSFDSVRAEIEQTRQRIVIGRWREQQANKLAWTAVAAAAVIFVALVAIRLLPTDGGIGVQATTDPAEAPTLTPIVSPTPVVDPVTGRIEPGSYVAHPFEPPNDDVSFRFVIPSRSWEALHAEQTGMIGVLRFGDSQGLGMGFQRISSLNGDPCVWLGTAEPIGQTVDDLVAGLTSSTEYETSDPTDVSLGGYAGKQVVVTMPEYAASECDDDSFTIWNPNGEGFNLPAFGPGQRWTLWILDVGGERVVIRLTDFEDSPADLRQELESIVESIQITTT